MTIILYDYNFTLKAKGYRLVFRVLSLPFSAKNEILAVQYSNVLQVVLSTFLCDVTIAFLYGTHILLVDVSV